MATDFPNDAANGGNITIEFSNFGPGVFTVESLKLIDFEEFAQDISSAIGKIVIKVNDGTEVEIDVGEFLRDNEIVIENGDIFELPVNLVGVSKIEIDLNDISGAFDDVVVCDPVTAAPTLTFSPTPAPSISMFPTLAPTTTAACPDKTFDQLVWPWLFSGNELELANGLTCEDVDRHTDYCAVFGINCDYGPYELEAIIDHFSEDSHVTWKRVFKITTLALLNICAPYAYPFDFATLKASVDIAYQSNFDDVPAEVYLSYKIANNGIDCEGGDELKCPLEGCPADEWKMVADYGCPNVDAHSKVCDLFDISCGGSSWESLTVGDVIETHYFTDYAKRKLQIFVAAYLNICSDSIHLYPYTLDELVSIVQEITNHGWWYSWHKMKPRYEPFEDANDNLKCPDLGPKKPTLAPTMAPPNPEGCPSWYWKDVTSSHSDSDLGCPGVTKWTKFCDLFDTGCGVTWMHDESVRQVLKFSDNTYQKHMAKQMVTAYLNACNSDVDYVFDLETIKSTVQNQDWNSVYWYDYDQYYWQNVNCNCPLDDHHD